MEVFIFKEEQESIFVYAPSFLNLNLDSLGLL